MPEIVPGRDERASSLGAVVGAARALAKVPIAKGVLYGRSVQTCGLPVPGLLLHRPLV